MRLLVVVECVAGIAWIAWLLRRAWRTYQADRRRAAVLHDRLLRSGHYGQRRPPPRAW